MAGDLTIQQVLADTVQEVGSLLQAGAADQFDLLASQIGRLQTVQQAAAEAVTNQTQILKSAIPSTPASSQGGFSGITSGLLTGLGSGFGVGPLISGLLSLFGNNDEPIAASPLLKFSLPPSVRVQAGVSRSSGEGPFGVDAAQGGLPRPVTTAPTQVTVQVNAMDSKSFLDHSTDIALAVRHAMLESSVLSDVVREA